MLGIEPRPVREDGTASLLPLNVLVPRVQLILPSCEISAIARFCGHKSLPVGLVFSETRFPQCIALEHITLEILP